MNKHDRASQTNISLINKSKLNAKPIIERGQFIWPKALSLPKKRREHRKLKSDNTVQGHWARLLFALPLDALVQRTARARLPRDANAPKFKCTHVSLRSRNSLCAAGCIPVDSKASSCYDYKRIVNNWALALDSFGQKCVFANCVA